jgi:RHS repeat-associated protein
MGIKPLDYEPEGSSRWKYNGGSEYEEATKWHETDYRIGYDDQLGRFHQTDLLAEVYVGITPYQFGFNNPVYFNDPSGLAPRPFSNFLTELVNSQASESKTYSGDAVREAYDAYSKAGGNATLDVSQDGVIWVDYANKQREATYSNSVTEGNHTLIDTDGGVQSKKSTKVINGGGSISQIGNWEGLIPFWGSLRSMNNAAQAGSGVGVVASLITLGIDFIPGKGPIGGLRGARSGLRSSWVKRFGHPGKGREIHHIIPWDLRNMVRVPGFNINHINNGINLSKYTKKAGWFGTHASHKAYNTYVRRLLGEMNNKRSVSELIEIMEGLTEKILEAERRGITINHLIKTLK